MLGHEFYFGSIRKYVTLVGTLFNDIVIDRVDESDEVVGTLRVPLSYGPKEKVLARLDNDPNLDRKYAITLPRISFEINNLNYAPERKLTTTTKNVYIDENGNRAKYQYVPVPYDLMFSVYIMAKTAEDGSRILEQILPFFTPEFTPRVDLIPEAEPYDIPVVLLDVVAQDVYEGNFDERRALIWTVNLLVKGFIFGPIRTKSVITLANVNFYDATLVSDIDNAVGNSNLLERLTSTPGLTSNNTPTSNAQISVDRNSILANSDYGYINTIENL